MKIFKSILISVVVALIGGLILSLFAGTNSFFDDSDETKKSETTADISLDSTATTTAATTAEPIVKLGDNHIVDQAALAAMDDGAIGYFVLDGKIYFGIKQSIPSDLLERDTYCCVIQTTIGFLPDFKYADNVLGSCGTSDLKTIESVVADVQTDTLGLDVGYFLGIFFEFEDCEDPEALLVDLKTEFFDKEELYSFGAYEADPPEIGPSEE